MIFQEPEQQQTFKALLNKLNEVQEAKEADDIQYDLTGVDMKRLEEAMMIKKMLQSMPKEVLKDSKWYIVSMEWIDKW